MTARFAESTWESGVVVATAGALGGGSLGRPKGSLRRCSSSGNVDGVTADLAGEMRRLAETFAEADARLDFTVASVAVLDDGLATGATDDERVTSAAYLGEVLIRHSRGGAWAYPPQQLGPAQRPSLRFGKWYTSPFERLDPMWAAGPQDTLKRYAEDLLAYVANPTDKTAKRLGWKKRVTRKSALHHLLESWRTRHG